MQKPWPVLKSDSEADDVVATADLAEYYFRQIVPMTFEHTAKDRLIAMRLSGGLLDGMKGHEPWSASDSLIAMPFQ